MHEMQTWRRKHSFLRASLRVEALSLRNELHIGVGFEPLDTAFGTVTGLLYTAERRLRSRDGDTVHSHHAGLYRVADGGGLRAGCRKGIGGKTVRQRVRALYDLIEGLERHDRRHRPERLLGHDLGIIRHVGDDGRLKEEALIAVS